MDCVSHAYYMQKLVHHSSLIANMISNFNEYKEAMSKKPHVLPLLDIRWFYSNQAHFV
jgi:hypothetical protein